MDELNIYRDEVKESERIIIQLDRQLSALKSQAKLEKRSTQLFQENNKLKKEHKNNLEDIKEYKSQLKEIQDKLNSQKSQMDALLKENEKIKANIRRKSESKSPIKKIRGISDLRKSFGFILKDLYNKKEKDEENDEIKEEENEDGTTPGCDTEEKEIEFEKLKKLKMDKEILFHKIHEDIVSYYKAADNELTYTTNYRNFIDSINNQIRSFKQQLRISVVGGANFNFGKTTDNNVKQLNKEMDETTFIINQINII